MTYKFKKALLRNPSKSISSAISSRGLKPNFAVKDNPLPWLDWVLNGVEHTNFFENRATEYAKGSMTGDLWG